MSPNHSMYNEHVLYSFLELQARYGANDRACLHLSKIVKKKNQN